MDPVVYFLVFIVVSVMIGAKAAFRYTITLREMVVQGVVTVGLVVVVTQMMFIGKASDVEILNGQITGKYQDAVSCEHSYECRCRNERDSKGKTYRVCDTCYEHSFDYDWILKTTVGRIEVPRVDRQGLYEPKPYSEAHAGDPVAKRRSYNNWVKAAPESVFHRAAHPDEFEGQIPSYPDRIRDVHYADRVLTAGDLHIPDLKAWSNDLAMRLRTIGPEREGNIVVVLTDLNTPTYADALERAWLRGRKNDTVVVIGTDGAGQEIKWARGFGWSRDKMLYVQLRDRLQDFGLVERDGVLDIIETSVLKHFDRHEMAEFESLKSDIRLSAGQRLFLIVLAFAASIGASFIFHRKEIF